MTELLEKAIAKMNTLSDEQKDSIATLILEELEHEAKWDKAFAKSQDALAQLAANAMAEYRAGKTEELAPDTL